MTVTLTFRPEIEAGLLARAQATGMTVEEYLLSMVHDVVFSPAAKALSPEQRAEAYESWSARHLPTPLLSDRAVSREAMYEGRDS